MPQTFADDFTGVADAVLNGRTVGGKSWSCAGTFTADVQGLKINASGQLKNMSSNGCLGRIEAGAADHYAQAKVHGPLTASVPVALAVRAVDQLNHIGMRAWTSTQVEIYKRVGSSTSQRVVLIGGLSLVAGQTWKLQIEGTTVKAFVGGTQIGVAGGYDVADAVFSGITKAGLWASLAPGGGTDPAFDDFEAGTVSSGPLVSVDEIGARRIVQRAKGATSKVLRLTGTYANGTPTGIEWRLEQELTPGTFTLVPGRDWSAVGSPSLGSGAWAGDADVPQGGWYRLRVRWAGGAAEGVTAGKFGVGVVLVVDGQSNAVGLGSSAGGDTADDLTSRFDGSLWALPTGAGEKALANALRGYLGVPVAVTNLGVGATAIASHVPGSSNWTAKMTRLAAIGGDVEGVLWAQGEADGGSTTLAAYKTALGQLYDGWRSATARSSGQLRFLIGVTGRNVGSTSGTDAGWQTVRQAQVEWADATAGAAISHHAIDLPMADDLHYTSAGYQEAGRRFARSYAAARGALSVDARGPAAALATVIGNEVWVGLSARGTVVGAAGAGALTGWQASSNDFASLLTITDAALVGGAVRLTLAGVPAGTVKVRHLYGREPAVGNLAGGEIA